MPLSSSLWSSPIIQHRKWKGIGDERGGGIELEKAQIMVFTLAEGQRVVELRVGHLFKYDERTMDLPITDFDAHRGCRLSIAMAPSKGQMHSRNAEPYLFVSWRKAIARVCAYM